MPGTERPRIFWYELAQKWAIRAPALTDPIKATMFVAALRQRCSAVFHQAAQAWLVPDEALETAKELVTKYYLHYQFVGRPQPREEPAPPPPPPPPPDSAYEVFCDLVGWTGDGLLSPARARALYRQAAARLHPDVGGSADKMAALNTAWRAIRGTLA